MNPMFIIYARDIILGYESYGYNHLYRTYICMCIYIYTYAYIYIYQSLSLVICKATCHEAWEYRQPPPAACPSGPHPDISGFHPGCEPIFLGSESSAIGYESYVLVYESYVLGYEPCDL